MTDNVDIKSIEIDETTTNHTSEEAAASIVDDAENLFEEFALDDIEIIESKVFA